MLNRLKWRLFIIWISLRWIFKTNLSDIVIYNGKEYFVNNGVNPGYWDIIENKDYYEGRECLDHIPRNLCKKKYSLKLIWRSYKNPSGSSHSSGFFMPVNTSSSDSLGS